MSERTQTVQDEQATGADAEGGVRSRRSVIAGVAAVAFAGCLKEEGAGLSTSHASAAVAAPVAAAATATIPTAAPSARALPDFTSLVEQTGPAVVNIAVTSVQKTVAGGLSPDDPFYDFLRRFGMPGAPGGQGAEPPGLGRPFFDPSPLALGAFAFRCHPGFGLWPKTGTHTRQSQQ